MLAMRCFRAALDTNVYLTVFPFSFRFKAFSRQRFRVEQLFRDSSGRPGVQTRSLPSTTMTVHRFLGRFVGGIV